MYCKMLYSIGVYSTDTAILKRLLHDRYSLVLGLRDIFFFILHSKSAFKYCHFGFILAILFVMRVFFNVLFCEFLDDVIVNYYN